MISSSWISAACGPGWPSSKVWASRAARWRAGRRPHGCSPPGRSGPGGSRPIPARCWPVRRPHKTLPGVLGQADTRAVLDAAAVAADDGSPVGLRDLAIMELLYATGIRVGELCALDVDEVDDSRRVVRVFGKGRKERSVPYGVPAGQALDAVAGRGAAEVGARGEWACGLFLGARGGRIDQRTVRRMVHERIAVVDAPDLVAARSAPHGGHASARGRCGPAQRAGAPGARVARDDPDLHPCLQGPAPSAPTSRRIPRA